MLKTIVCTGGIGSGKSYFVKVLQKMGVPVYFSDQRAKELYSLDKQLARELAVLLGEDIFEDGLLRKEIMASKIFSDSTLLAEVNKLVHPKVLVDFDHWRNERKKNRDTLVVLESAIYFETPIFHSVPDIVVVVSAPEELRVKRVMERDGIPEHRVRERMALQCSEEERLSGADFVIFADGKRAVLPQAHNLLSRCGFFDKSI